MSDVRAGRSGPGPGRVLRRALFGAVLLALLVLIGACVRVWQVARTDDRRPVDMIVVLGALRKKNGRQPRSGIFTPISRMCRR